MANIDEQILRAAKEIVVKFIEAGRISPSGFNETFINVYRTVEKTTKDSVITSYSIHYTKLYELDVLIDLENSQMIFGKCLDCNTNWKEDYTL